MTSPALLTAEEVATYLRVPLATVHYWRVKGTGPKASKVGKHLRYRLSDIDAWLDSQAA